MKHDVEFFVKGCQVCQQTKPITQSPADLLTPLPIPEQVWEDVLMDFITSLPKSNGYFVILVMVDRLTKYCHFGALETHYNATKVTQLCMHMVVRLHGYPTSIVSDRDNSFNVSSKKSF